MARLLSVALLQLAAVCSALSAAPECVAVCTRARLTALDITDALFANITAYDSAALAANITALPSACLSGVAPPSPPPPGCAMLVALQAAALVAQSALFLAAADPTAAGPRWVAAPPRHPRRPAQLTRAHVSVCASPASCSL